MLFYELNYLAFSASTVCREGVYRYKDFHRRHPKCTIRIKSFIAAFLSLNSQQDIVIHGALGKALFRSGISMVVFLFRI